MYGKRANLKCCPLCGGKAKFVHRIADDTWGVFCPKCGAEKPRFGDKALAAKDWNYRYGGDELEYMIDFAKEGDCDISHDQLRCLWTAYCFHHNLDVDTAQYDSDLKKLWDIVVEANPDNGDWRDFETFDNFMCKFLV